MSTITVIIPVYNVEPYLRQCLDSIVGQIFSDFSVILIDDDSTDCSRQICDEYAVSDFSFHVVLQQNAGVSAARNTGSYNHICGPESGMLSFREILSDKHECFSG